MEPTVPYPHFRRGGHAKFYESDFELDPKDESRLSDPNSAVGIRIPVAVIDQGIELIKEALDKILKLPDDQ